MCGKLCITFIFGVILSFVTYIYLTPSPINSCESVDLGTVEFKGVLSVNNQLSGADLLFVDFNRSKNEFPSPLRAEAFETDGEGGYYSGLGDGRIIHLKREHGVIPPTFTMETVIRTGNYSEHCGHPDFEHICGRPLGLHYHPLTKTMFIADTLGLLELNLETKSLRVVKKEHNGIPLTFPNAIAISKEGLLYFSDSSVNYTRARVLYSILENCAGGRLFRYNPFTDELDLILESLCFPNGIHFVENEEALLICESTRARILKYYISGPKKGQLSVFISNLPGFPDNIRFSHESNVFWLGMSSRSPLLSLPSWIRETIAKFDLNRIAQVLPSYGLIAAIDLNGNIVRTLQDPTGRVGYVSEIVEENGYLILGSWKSDFIARVDGTQYLPLKIGH